MKKLLTGIISILMVATLCMPCDLAYGSTVVTEEPNEEFDISGVELESDEYFVGSDITSNKTVASVIDYMMGKYKNESVFPGNGELCVAYANKLNGMIASKNKTTTYYGKGVSEANYKKYIMGCKPGTIIRFSYEPNGGYRGHSIVVLKATRDMVWWAECNRGGHNVVHYYKDELCYFVGHCSYFPYMTAKTEPVKYKTYSTIKLVAWKNPVTTARQLSWTNVMGASSYDIYRATSKDGTYEKITTSGDTTFVDSTAELGKSYYYKVQTTLNGKTISSTAKKISYSKLNAPYLRAKIEGDTATFYWDKVDGADKYKLCEKTWEGYKLWSEQTATTYTIKLHDESEEDEYGSFYVQAICSSNSKQNSPNSMYAWITYYNDDLKPQVQAKTLSDGTVQLSWNSFGDSYAVYKSAYKLGRYFRVATVEDASTITWNDTCGKKGETYYYYVVSLRDIYYTVDRSTIVSAGFTNATNDTKEYKKWRDLIVNDRIDTPNVKYEILSKGVKLSWDEVDIACAYTITRKDVKTGKKIEDFIQQTTYTDKSAKKGKTYVYTVTAEGPDAIRSKTKSIKVKVSN